MRQPLAPEARAELLGESCRLRHVLDAVIAYERGDWERCRAESESIGADATVLPRAYAKALRWQATTRGF